MGPSLLSTVPKSSFTTPSTLSTMGHSCVRRRQVLQENRSGPRPEQGTADFSPNHLLSGPGVQGKSECADGLGDTQAGGRGGGAGLWCRRAEQRAQRASYMGPLRKPRRRPGEQGRHISEASWGVGAQPSLEETKAAAPSQVSGPSCCPGGHWAT